MELKSLLRLLPATLLGLSLSLALSGLGFLVIAALGLPPVPVGLLSLLGVMWLVVGGYAAGRAAGHLGLGLVAGMWSGAGYIFFTLLFRWLTRGPHLDAYVVEELLLDLVVAVMAGVAGAWLGRPKGRVKAE